MDSETGCLIRFYAGERGGAATGGERPLGRRARPFPLPSLWSGGRGGRSPSAGAVASHGEGGGRRVSPRRGGAARGGPRRRRASRGVSGAQEIRAAPQLARWQGSLSSLQRVGNGGRSSVVFRFQWRHWASGVNSALICRLPWWRETHRCRCWAWKGEGCLKCLQDAGSSLRAELSCVLPDR